LVLTTVLKLAVGSHDKIGHRSRHEHFTRPSQVADPLGNGHRQTGDVVATDFDLARVDADA
jgi:hypothetical protein